MSDRLDTLRDKITELLLGPEMPKRQHPGWNYHHGCKCHHMTFCPDLEFARYEDDVPVYKYKKPRP